MQLKSEIKRVTVYNDRALIERVAIIKLTSGEHELIFGGLPANIDANSIQVGGGEKCVLQEIKLKTAQLEEIPDEQKKELYHEIEQLHEQVEEMNDKLEILNNEKELLQKLTEVSSEIPKKGMLSLIVPEKVNDILGFYAEKMSKLNESVRTGKRELKKLNEEVEKLKNQAKAYRQQDLKTEKQVHIKLFIEEEAEQTLILSYIAMQAGWKPIYDFRLNSDEKKLNISYNAIVTQKTGEKWENVSLNLSTARPNISAIKPGLSPWYVDVYQEIISAPKMKKMMRSASPVSMNEMEGGALDKFDEMLEEAPVPILEAKVETGTSAVFFSIPGNHSILDDDEEHKIGIGNLNFDAKLDYHAVPKLSSYAYLTATFTNSSDFPMLKGSANIFLDNSFVSHSKIKLIAPNQEDKISLGVDEAINIEHKLINKFTKDEGIFSKRNKIIYEYRIEIKNNKKIDCSINILDQIPVSMNKDINVELFEPRYKEDTPALKKSEDGIIEIKNTIKPGEQIQFNLKFSVEYPREIRISGLE